MRKSRFTDEQMVVLLREADRSSVAEVARKHKVSEQTIYGWRKHFVGLEPQDVKRLKTLEFENAYLLAGQWEEDWTYKACDQVGTIRVKFSADGLGGARVVSELTGKDIPALVKQ